MTQIQEDANGTALKLTWLLGDRYNDPEQRVADRHSRLRTTNTLCGLTYVMNPPVPVSVCGPSLTQ
jgi:hypothetical protein